MKGSIRAEGCLPGHAEAGPSAQGLLLCVQGHPSFDLGRLSDSQQASKVL